MSDSQPKSFCSQCGEQLQPTANFCPRCAARVQPSQTYSFRPVVDDSPTRKVGVGLGLGILFLPYVFSWFTLRQGHTTLAKTVSFIWMGLFVLAWALHSNEPSARYTGTNSSSGYQASSSPTEPVSAIQTPTPNGADSTGKIVGIWDAEKVFGKFLAEGVRYTIRREAGHLILDDGTSNKQTLVEKTVRGTKRLYPKPPTYFRPGDYMVIEKDGRLGLYDNEGFIDALPRTR